MDELLRVSATGSEKAALANQSDDSDESPLSKIAREAYVVGCGVVGGVKEGFKEAWQDPCGTGLRLGLSIGIGFGLGYFQRSAGLLRLGSQAFGTALGASFALDVMAPRRWSAISTALADTWNSGKNTARNLAVVENNLGRFAFDTGIMTAGGIGGALMGEGVATKLPQWRENRLFSRQGYSVVWERPGFVKSDMYYNQSWVHPSDHPGEVFVLSEVRKDPDGTLAPFGPFHNKLVRGPDGTISTKLDLGESLLKKADGTVITVQNRFGNEPGFTTTWKPHGTRVVEYDLRPGDINQPKTEIWLKDGTYIRESQSGATVTTLPDGARVFDGGQTVVTQRPDGTTVHAYKNGVKLTERPDGTFAAEFPKGTQERIEPDGTVIKELGDSKWTQKPDGTTLFDYFPNSRDRVLLMRQPDGTIVADRSFGTTTYKPDGTKIVNYGSGGIETRLPNGTLVIEHAGLGRRALSMQPDGTCITEYYNGVKVTEHRDGTFAAEFPKGAQERIEPDGTVIKELGDSKWTQKPDGTTIFEHAPGTRDHVALMRLPDGTIKKGLGIWGTAADVTGVRETGSD